MFVNHSLQYIARIIFKIKYSDFPWEAGEANRHIQNKQYLIIFWLWLAGCWLANSGLVRAQVTSDDTVGTEVNTVDGVSEITGGTRADSNLFHSFQDFSVQTGNTAYFNNAGDISNIVGRVTGANISNIDGLIRANGDANLILINPNGIIFGANARLDIGGAFLGSTADSVVFADGTSFSARDTQVDPILTVSVPLGLQLGQNPAEISVLGNGHNLTVADPLFSPITFGEQTGLRVKSGETLALVGGGITFDGGTVSAPGGRIELGSVSEGLVNLDFANSGLSLGYADVTALDNIQLRSQSLVDVSGTESTAAGSIYVQGKQLSLTDGSLLLVQNLAGQKAGDININASELITVSGTNQDSTIRSSLTNETLGIAEGGDIQITTSQLTVDGGATVVAKTLPPGTGKGGNLTINADESIEVVGSSSLDPSVTSSIVAASFGAGAAGNSNITTSSLTLRQGGTIVATVFDTGDGGDLSIAADTIEVIGIEPNIFAPSAITASTLGSADAGNLTIDTSSLSLLEGGRVDASSAAAGNAGNIAIAASDSITIDGTVPDSSVPSLIIASANIFDPALRELLRLPDFPTGNSGNITITTPQLSVTAGGQLTVRNDGTGDAGTINVEANRISLNSGGISAAAQNGQSGNLNLQARDIFLTNSSQVSNVNFGVGDGGNINIDTDILQISDRSLITATTFGAGNGGSVEIAASNIDIVGTSFAEFQQNFQLAAIEGTLTPEDLGTGIFVGTAATGTAGDLIIDTDSLTLSQGAVIFSPVFTAGIGGDINISANDIDISASAIQMGTAGTTESSTSGNIDLNTQRLKIRDGGTIINTTLGNASTGNINITASESIEIKNTPIEAIALSGIYANTFGTGAGGDININTPQLKLIDSLISTNTGGIVTDGTIIETGGKGGNINITATESIEASGIPDNPFLTSGIGTSSYSDSNAGDLTISTGKLTISDGADFATATLGAGSGGQLAINATDSIELIGATTSEGTNQGGLLATSGRREFPNLSATGDSGAISIITPQLTVRDGASVDVQSLGVGDGGDLTITSSKLNIDNEGTISIGSVGTGDAGTLKVDADLISLNNQSVISADTQSGGGANIVLNADNIFWQGSSVTSARARSTGDGGNITLNANNLVALEASKIQADAVEGRGGNIEIDTQGLFICQECQISASSQLGVDGVVDIETIQPNTQLEILDIPQQPTQPQETVALACPTNATNTSQLTVTGRGGLPPRPQAPLNSSSLITFDNNNSTKVKPSNRDGNAAMLPSPARSWYVNPDGTVVLSARASATAVDNSATNIPNCPKQ